MKPLKEPMFTIRPRATRNQGSMAWIMATWPIRFTSNCWRRSSIGTNSRGPMTAMPALFTSPHSPCGPTAFSTAAAAAAISAAVVTSRGRAWIAPLPNCSRRRPSSGSRTPAKTRKPCLARSKAHAAPIPVEAPLMTTDFRESAITSFHPWGEAAMLPGFTRFSQGMTIPTRPHSLQMGQRRQPDAHCGCVPTLRKAVAKRQRIVAIGRGFLLGHGGPSDIVRRVWRPCFAHRNAQQDL
mgnify:CR=1 FL=1